MKLTKKSMSVIKGHETKLIALSDPISGFKVKIINYRATFFI